MANFLDDAKDITEEVGYAPVSKAIKKPKKEENFLEAAKDLGEAPKNAGQDVDPSVLQKIANVVDIPASIVRTGVEAAISPERDILPAIGEQINRTVESPTTAAMTAPRGTDIAKAAFPDFKEDSIEGQVAGFVTEAALDPLAWFTAGSKPVKAARKGLESASERQAAKALAKYSSKGEVLKEGADIEAIGARLVAEDLQGLIKNPVKLYEKVAGKRHLQKINPENLETLQIKRGVREPGLIGETSNNITSAISTIENQYGLQPILPANIMAKQILDKMRVSLSKVSGETPDLTAAEKTLENALKPFTKQPIPPVIGQTGKSFLQNPTKLSLSELHELRKNIGKQVSDRSFYATPDQAMKAETEVLRDLYREIGNVIEGQLKGKQLTIGNTTVDAGDYYKAQNNRLKSYLDLESMLEYAPTQELKSADIPSMVAKAGAKGTVFGAMGLGASLAGVPVNPVMGAGLGMMYGAGSSVADTVGKATPEYLTSILKTAGKVAPAGAAGVQRGTIQYMQDGKFVPTQQNQEEKFQRPEQIPSDKYKMFPNLMPKKSTMLTPREIINFKIPRSTQGILENKEHVLAKLSQNGVPGEMIDTIAMALDQDQEAVGNIAPLVVTQFPTLFERSKYKVFDGQFLDPADRAKAADDISKRNDLDSIARAKMIDQINKNNKVPEGLV